jgi:hypothetical protein
MILVNPFLKDLAVQQYKKSFINSSNLQSVNLLIPTLVHNFFNEFIY